MKRRRGLTSRSSVVYKHRTVGGRYSSDVSIGVGKGDGVGMLMTSNGAVLDRRYNNGMICSLTAWMGRTLVDRITSLLVYTITQGNHQLSLAGRFDSLTGDRPSAKPLKKCRWIGGFVQATGSSHLHSLEDALLLPTTPLNVRFGSLETAASG